MVDQQRDEGMMMPYDAYYVNYAAGNQATYPAYYSWPGYQPYPVMPYPPYPSYPAVQTYQASPAYEAGSNMQETANQATAVTTNAADSKVLQQFMNENGQVDIQKMLQTVGQFADTVQQVSPVIKQLNELVRSFRT